MLDPTELGRVRAQLLELETSDAAHESSVIDLHGFVRRPSGDLHSVHRVEGSEPRQTVELGSDTRSLIGDEGDRLRITHPFDVALNVGEVTPDDVDGAVDLGADGQMYHVGTSALFTSRREGSIGLVFHSDTCELRDYRRWPRGAQRSICRSVSRC
ncbi:MAG: hypothetical protein H6512_06100 [Acidimicrobiia bacterium]|nr:hypothetical protein [Acidimicrobiia bacterium]